MDCEKHEHFHSWLMWKKKKSGKYPPFSDQKRILESEYGGTLLENVKQKSKPAPNNETKSEHKEISYAFKIADHDNKKSFDFSLNTNIKNADLDQVDQTTFRKQLFSELKRERRRLAEKANISVYMVFDNKTLLEMTEEMPETEDQMLHIKGVGQIKMEMYGTYFLTIIKIFKEKLAIESNRKKDPA